MRAHIFRVERKRLKLTQDELAAALGISKRTIGRYEAGKIKVPERTAIAFNLLISAKKQRTRKPKP